MIAFSGHRIDEIGRTPARFPPEAEQPVADMLGATLDNFEGEIVSGFGALASGGDILFHEACLDRGIPTTILLPLPVEPFLAASVTPSGQSWTDRARWLLTQRPFAVIADATETNGIAVFERGNLWILQEAIQAAKREEAEPAVVVIWDGEHSGLPGGTDHIVQIANQHGIPVTVIDPTEHRR
ncbi:MAG: hypothetical protein ACN4GZ_17560 [Acidimicrobiales bacterium]